MAALGASLLLSLLFAALSWQAAGLTPERARALLRPLPESGVLFEVRRQPLGPMLAPRWYGNDCLVLSMLVLPREGSQAHEAFSPHLAASPQAPLAKADPAGGWTAGACLRLAELLEPGAERALGPRYGRYLHGHLTTAALLLPVLGPVGLQWAVLWTLVGLLAGLPGFAGLRAALRLRRGDPGWRRDAGFAWVAFCLLAFYGLPTFGFWVSHAMSDVVLAAFLWAMLLLPGEEGAGSPWLVGAFGCCVSLFEFLTGGLPLGAGLVLLATALASRPQGALRSLAAFLAGAALPFVLKAAVAQFAFPDATGLENAGAFLHRLNGPVLPELPREELVAYSGPGLDLTRLDEDALLRIRYMAHRLWRHVWLLGSGSYDVGKDVIGGSLLGIGLAGVLALRRDWRRALPALGAGLLLLAWYLAFLNHSLLHAVWMVRCAVILPAAFGVLLLLCGPRRAAPLPHGLPAETGPGGPAASI